MKKLCGICGQDCADRPRVRDRQGRYYCEQCSLRAALRPAEAGAAPGPLPAGANHPYALADEQPPPPAQACPLCGHTHAPGAQVCVYCGFDEAQGLASSRVYRRAARRRGRRHQGPRCRECGYSLLGLVDPIPICPECGTRVSMAVKDELREELERDVIRREWIKPAAWLGVGFAGMLVASGLGAGLAGLIVYPVLLLVQVLIGYAVLWVCFSFLGDLGTPLLNLLRLAGIYALVDLIGAAAGLLPVVILPWAITLACYVGLFSDAFDTDWAESLLVIILTACVKVAAVVTLVYWGLTM